MDVVIFELLATAVVYAAVLESLRIAVGETV
jgi:hypothetical protein